MYSLIWWLMTIMMMMCLSRTSGNIFIVSRETLRKRCCCWLYTTADHVILNVSVKDGALGIVGGTGIVASKYHRSTLSKMRCLFFFFFTDNSHVNRQMSQWVTTFISFPSLYHTWLSSVIQWHSVIFLWCCSFGALVCLLRCCLWSSQPLSLTYLHINIS